MDEKKNTRGGKREGAGRKKTTEKRIMFGASVEVAAIIERLEGSKSDYINKAILAYAKLNK
ncbi:MAG: hypothetical protein IKP81_14640 [Paludibacteraceae bacterium]|nr:hypothetical protein [Paludibacteraceae bacterium]